MALVLEKVSEYDTRIVGRGHERYKGRSYQEDVDEAVFIPFFPIERQSGDVQQRLSAICRLMISYA